MPQERGNLSQYKATPGNSHVQTQKWQQQFEKPEMEEKEKKQKQIEQ